MAVAPIVFGAVIGADDTISIRVIVVTEKHALNASFQIPVPVRP
jgi:hypothetical protein